MSKDFDFPGSNDFGSSATPYQEFPESFEPEAKRGHGCFFYGCITALVLLVLAAIGTYGAYRFISGKFREYVAEYTDDAPRPLPVVDIPQEKRDEIIKRSEDFQKRLMSPPAPGEPRTLTDEQRTLVLTADELNALFEKSPEVRGKFYVTIKDGELGAQVSIPLNELPWLTGRYLNGEARVVVSVVDGEPVVQLRDVMVKGKPLHPSLRATVEGMNLAAEKVDEQGKAKPRRFARKIEKIEIKDGKLTIVARKQPEDAGSEPSSPVDDPPKEAEQGKDTPTKEAEPGKDSPARP